MVATPAATPVFGKYSLVAKLATGGMAEIFLARLSGVAGFEKLVCIKRILPHLAKDQALVGMFLSEAKIAAAISHPNVCQVFELGEIDGRYFIAMEYLEGVPLSCFRRRDMYPPPPDPRLVAGLGLQACEGLHHAHQLKKSDGSPMEVVHRDVSSNNLFATVDGVVKVLDFGIAKVQDASVRTSTGSVKGTYAYMAPEQLRGEKLDRRTDVFAMGTVLWELFARRHLFKRDTDFLTFQAITTDPIPDVCELRPDVPPELAATIAKALSRNREDRFPNARALGEELARSVASLGGPLSASAISDVIAQAFDARLRDQQHLIRIARSGGALPLDEDLGPGVGHGTALVTTPVSMLSAPEISAIPAPPVPAAPPRSKTIDVPQLTRSRAPVVISVVLLALLAGGAVAFYVWINRTPDRAQPAVAAADRVVINAQPAPDASDVAGSYTARPVDSPGSAGARSDAERRGVSIDAAVAVEVDAAPVAAVDAAVEITPDAAVPTRHDSGPPRPPPAKKPPAVVVPAGPPGFITIDSAPVYAVIFIDGKRHGETPLVRVPLAPGRHSIRAVSASGTSQTMSIAIESGKVAQTRRFEW